MNKLFLVLMLAVMALGLTACLPEKETPEYIPPYVEPGNTYPVDEQPVDGEPVEEQPVEGEPVDEQPVEEQPVDEEPTPEVITDKTVEFDKSLTMEVWETITLDVKGYTQIKLTLKATSIYDVPVNIDNFKVDGNEVTHTGVSGTSYLLDKAFNIGELNAVGHLINTHQGNLRLHTLHKDKGTEHFITIDVADINTFEFQYKITTTAFEYLDAIVIDFIV